jgi:uncharacterized membrane protein YecN with MAPEG domain
MYAPPVLIDGTAPMQSYLYTALVTLLASLTCVWMATQVSRAHVKAGILPPVMIGDPDLEKAIRGHTNTLEWMPIFLPALWLFAIYWSDAVAALAGAVWIVGRIVYFLGYSRDAKKRFPGFFIQAMAVIFLWLGALGRIVYLLAVHPAG